MLSLIGSLVLSCFFMEVEERNVGVKECRREVARRIVESDLILISSCERDVS